MAFPDPATAATAATGQPAATPMNPRWLLYMPPGVSLDRIQPPEVIMHERLCELAGSEIGSHSEPPVYDKLPKWFVAKPPWWPNGLHTGEDAWPPQCNQRCSACTLTFQGFPWFVPLAVEVREVPPQVEGQSMVRVPAFQRGQVTCSPNCAMTFIESHFRGEEGTQLKELLVHLYHAVTGRWVIHIEPAPRHTQLQAYGGDLSDQEFWIRMRGLVQQTHLSIRNFDFPLLSADDSDGVDGWKVAEDAIPYDAATVVYPALGAPDNHALDANDPQLVAPRPIAPIDLNHVLGASRDPRLVAAPGNKPAPAEELAQLLAMLDQVT
jgi:hypothetical protein